MKNVLYAGADEGARLERMSLDPIARVDPDFSAILFEDSAFRLYATAHGCRGEHRKLDELAPYLSARARKSLASRAPAGRAVTGVVIGQMRPIRVNVGRAGSVT